MSGLVCQFIVQGTGRGHLTQALALTPMLTRAGHRVCSAIVSCGSDHVIPEFFKKQFTAPIDYVASGHFIMDPDSQSIDWGKTVLANAGRWNEFAAAFATIGRSLARYKPDVIINFYEPLGGLYVISQKPAIPMVAVAHQFMFFHPDYQFPEGFALQRRSTQFFTRLTGLGAVRYLALSLYDAPRAPRKQLVVLPPLLRDELFQLSVDESAPFYLTYLFHHSLSSGVIQGYERYPDRAVHCYWSNPEAEETVRYSDGLTFHQLHGRRFLEMLASCEGVVTTSGFETMSEAMYLGKPLLVNPVRKHFEQHCNAIDGANLGACVYADTFDFKKLASFVASYSFDATAFRHWVGRAESMFVEQIERVATGE